MGICMSVASSDIQETKEVINHDQNNAIFIDSIPNRFPRLGSVYSQQGSKGLNQDAAIICQGFGMEDGAFCGVFDGHGQNGQIASKLVRNGLPALLLDQKNALSSLNSVSNEDDYVEDEGRILDGELVSNSIFDEWRKACIGAYKVMDKELKLQENLDCSCSGTTAVTIIKQGQDLIIANLGDSRAVLGTTSDDGELMAVQLTTDLKPGIPEEAERIRKSNGRIFALKDEAHIERVWLPNEDYPGLAMARAFGDFELKDYGIIAIPQISYRRLNNKDKFLVLASDGVWDVLSNNQVVTIVASAKREDLAAKAVVDAAVASWKRKYPFSKMDDCTVACLFLQER
ncbi:Protein phosphatase 2C (PP2C)-like domain [Macleaya cordata]|uniref:Protein phosphatase 2C (PP2C)-like domain n=1 Tax=Macleaya cordata TaxID=56857 RepID=A0A200QML2_MACCD|nr:Protein phosphatase 2C (PP2C)-like domain [Macleaya cordata]